MLGLGLGINKNNVQLDAFRNLIKSASWSISPLYASGVKRTDFSNLNSPFINPIIDLSGVVGNKANGLLTNFAGTSVSGYVLDTAPNGKSVVGLKPDGVDDVVVFGSNAPNPVGAQDFAFGFVFKTPATLTGDKVFYGRSIGNSVFTDFQVVIFTNGTDAKVLLTGFASITTATGLVANSFYKLIVKRIGGRLICILNNLETYNQANTTSLVDKFNARLFALASNVGGTTHAAFGNHTLFEAEYTATNIADWEAKFNAWCLKQYGL